MNYIQPRLLYYINCDPSNSSFGHSMYNYISGLLFSKEAGLEFIHSDLQGYAERFNDILNLRNKFKTIDNIEIYKNIQLDIFDFRKEGDIEKCHGEIKRHIGDGILFNLDFKKGNLFPGRLIKNSEWLVDIFSSSYFEKNKKLQIYEPSYKNVSIHIRRGDITEMGNPDRWQPNSYYINIINKLSKDPLTKFFIISDGSVNDFIDIQNEFKDLDIFVLPSSHESSETVLNCQFNSRYNLILGGKDTEVFHMLSQSDVLVTGQSSFSTVCSYINKGDIIYTKCKEFTDFENFKNKRFINASSL